MEEDEGEMQGEVKVEEGGGMDNTPQQRSRGIIGIGIIITGDILLDYIRRLLFDVADFRFPSFDSLSAPLVERPVASTPLLNDARL